MSRSQVHVFSLESIADYLKFCQQAVDELASDQANVLRGFPAILAINHIPDWLQYKLTSSQRITLGLSEIVNESVKEHYELNYSDLGVIRSVANGFKHLRPVHPTRRVAGYGQGPYGVGPYGAPYLLVDRGESHQTEKRYSSANKLCREALDFWIKTLQPILEEPTS